MKDLEYRSLYLLTYEWGTDIYDRLVVATRENQDLRYQHVTAFTIRHFNDNLLPHSYKRVMYITPVTVKFIKKEYYKTNTKIEIKKPKEEVVKFPDGVGIALESLYIDGVEIAKNVLIGDNKKWIDSI